jgi:folate-dependent phosphoribosylglycinamide formyltransferase PurN
MKKVKFAFIASGGGTDFQACIDDIQSATGLTKDLIDPVALFATNKKAGVIARAQKAGVPDVVIDFDDLGGLIPFNVRLTGELVAREIEVLLSVGCKKKVFPIEGVLMVNIHPAPLKKHGGDGMCNLKPHLSVLAETYDLINRGRKKIDDDFFTNIVVHKINSANGYDNEDDEIVLEKEVKIPTAIIAGYFSARLRAEESLKKLRSSIPVQNFFGRGLWLSSEFKDVVRTIIEEADNYKKEYDGMLAVAKELQQHVLKYEHEILPLAMKAIVEKLRKD